MVNREQIRAARAWLGLSQEELAKLAKVGSRTIKDFERGASTPYERTLRDIEEALEKLGIDFLFENQIGVGLRIRANTLLSAQELPND